MTAQVVAFVSPHRAVDNAIFHAGITAGNTLRTMLDELEVRTPGVNRQGFVECLTRTVQDAGPDGELAPCLQMAQALMTEYRALGIPMKPAPFIQGLIYALQDREWLPEAEKAHYFSALSARIRTAARWRSDEQSRNEHHER